MSGNKSKRGMATVLGMIIFVGILFTCVIPLFLYVNEVNNLYDRTVVEMKHFDQQQEREQIDVYAYALNKTSDQLNVHIRNRCPLSVKIVRIWVNDNNTPVTFEVPSMSENTTQINVELPEEGTGSFNIKVTTNRGNIFSSLTNTLHYTVGAGEGSGWSGGTGFSIQIIIEATFGSYDIKIYDSDGEGPIGSPFFDDDIFILLGTGFKRVDVGDWGWYWLKVTKNGWGGGVKLKYNSTVDVTLDEPSQWVYVQG